MQLEWKMRLLTRLMAASARPKDGLTPQIVRAERDRLNGSPLARLIFGRPRPLPAVKDITLTGRHGPLGGRVYRPIVGRTAPGLVYYHGGGWVIGDLDSHDVLCRRLAAESGRIVVAIDYRLAPEHKFPVAVDDAYDAFVWVHDRAADLGIDPAALAVGGDSAGGNLAAVVCQTTRDENGPAVERQLLIYPATDASRTYPSADTYANAPILTKSDMDWFLSHYQRAPDDRADPRFSPLLGNLEDLPPALIITAEYDPLIDEGRAYADALRAAGNHVLYREYARQVHGFLSIAPVAGRSADAFADAAAFLRATPAGAIDATAADAVAP